MKNANEQVKGVLDQLVRDGPEIGLQVAAYLNGNLVVDTCAGMADPSVGRPITSDTLFMAASCTKAIVATCIHLNRNGDHPVSGSANFLTDNDSAYYNGLTQPNIPRRRVPCPKSARPYRITGS